MPKLRSDSIIYNTNFIDLYETHKNKKSNIFYKIKNRLLMPHAFKSSHSPFYVSDLYQYGKREDMLSYWFSIQLQPRFKEEIKQLNFEEFASIYLIAPEQYLCSSFVKSNTPILFKHRHDITNQNINISDDFIFSTSIIAEPDVSGIRSLKYPEIQFLENSIFYNNWLYRNF